VRSKNFSQSASRSETTGDDDKLSRPSKRPTNDTQIDLFHDRPSSRLFFPRLYAVRRLTACGSRSTLVE